MMMMEGERKRLPIYDDRPQMIDGVGVENNYLENYEEITSSGIMDATRSFYDLTPKNRTIWKRLLY